LYLLFADVSTLCGRLGEIESIQTGLQRQLETIENKMDALTANQGVQDCLSNTAEHRLVIESSILSTGQTTGTVREELAPAFPTHSSDPISSPTTQAIPTQISMSVTEAKYVQVNEAISSPVNEEIYGGKAKAISTPTTGVVSNAITASELEATSATSTRENSSKKEEHTAPQFVSIGNREGDTTQIKHDKAKHGDLLAVAETQKPNTK